MKTIAVTLIMLFGATAFAGQSLEPAVIDSAALDANMNLTMGLRLSNPCDHAAAPQVMQDPSNPTLLKIEGVAHKSDGICIDRIAESTQKVNLPALMEMSQIKISKLQTYLVQFEGFEGEFVVPGSKLMISIQPQPITE